MASTRVQRPDVTGRREANLVRGASPDASARRLAADVQHHGGFRRTGSSARGICGPWEIPSAGGGSPDVRPKSAGQSGWLCKRLRQAKGTARKRAACRIVPPGGAGGKRCICDTVKYSDTDRAGWAWAPNPTKADLAGVLAIAGAQATSPGCRNTLQYCECIIGHPQYADG
jgi:hypothetical protein